MTMLQHGLVPSTGGYQIERSLRFNSADSAYLSRTFGTPTSQKTMTFSAWVKLSKLSNINTLLSSYSGTSWGHFVFDANNKLEIYSQTSGSANCVLVSTQVFRDPSAWGHLVIAIDTGQATSTNRVRAYWNGTEITAWGTATYPAQNADVQFQVASRSESIGRRADGGDATQDLGAYLANVYFIDGQQLTPSSFGETNADTGVWQPKAYTGTYGTNGFQLLFADNSGTTSTTLGKDTSGNGNNWTPNNFSVTAGAGNDSLVDTPTPYGTDTGAGGEVRGNYCTLNPLDKNSSDVVKNGNLDAEVQSYRCVVGTMAVTSGKWYWEVTPTGNSGSLNYMLGIADANTAISTRTWQGANGWYYFYNGNKYNNGSSASYGASYTTNDVIGIALDMDAGTVTFYKNGSSQGQAYSGLTGKAIQPSVSDGSSSFYQYYTANFGQRPFAYTAPSGFKALCTQNLPTPTIGATATTRADDYFNTVLYTGTGSSLGVTGVGFQPDWVWIKERSGAADHGLYDAVRGVQKQLESNNTDAETTETTGLTAFNSDGFTVGALAQLNTNTDTYVAWNWKANGAGSSNTSGTITSTVSANTTAGFSIVTYTGNGTNGATVGHGLGVAPSMIIVKNRDGTANWPVYHSALGNTKALFLSTTSAADTDVYWNNTSPTSSVFTVNPSGVALNASSTKYVAYAFTPVAGYSAFGSYTGNGSTDGPFVYTGFRPKYVMIKRTDSTGSWYVYDSVRNTYNLTNLGLLPNTSDAELTLVNAVIDMTSNGFKIRGTDTGINASAGTYIYSAFAEVPTKFSLAR